MIKKIPSSVFIHSKHILGCLKNLRCSNDYDLHVTSIWRMFLTYDCYKYVVEPWRIALG